MHVNGEPTTFTSPRSPGHGYRSVPRSRDRAPDGGVAELLPRQRDHPGFWPFKGLRTKYAKESCKAELARWESIFGTLSSLWEPCPEGRQAVSIARLYFGANVLILDEPTSAPAQSGVVLKHIRNAADAGVSVVFITHNPHHAYLVGDNSICSIAGR